MISGVLSLKPGNVHINSLSWFLRTLCILESTVPEMPGKKYILYKHNYRHSVSWGSRSKQRENGQA